MSEMFLALDGVKGESLAEEHGEEIVIHDWKWKLTNDAPPNLKGPDAAKHAGVEHITIDKLVDNASVTLVNYCAQGTRVDYATITCRKNAGDTEGVKKVDYLLIELTNVKVERVEWFGRGEGHVIPEQVELSFLEFKIVYFIQYSDGTVPTGGNEFHFNVPEQKGQPAKPHK